MLDLREKGMHHMRSPDLRRSRAAVSAIVLALFLAGCATSAASLSPAPTVAPTPTAALTAAPTATPSAFPVTVTDDEGTAVTIPAEPKKIVSLTPAATEILFAIGAGPRVVGKMEDLASFPPEANSLPDVGTYKGIAVEKIVALGADLVISGGVNFGQGDADDQLRKAKIPVIVAEPATTAGVVNDIRFIGTATGLSSNANALADSMSTAFDTVRSATAGISHPKVFYEIDATSMIYTAYKGSFLEELLSIAGADPITSGGSNSDIPLETLVSDNPDVILLGDTASGVTPAEVEKRPGWGTMTAVKKGAIFPVDDIVASRPGPRLVDGLLALLKAIHPELVTPSFPPLPVFVPTVP
jgi:iron complex transport system substrate-binding protein